VAQAAQATDVVNAAANVTATAQDVAAAVVAVVNAAAVVIVIAAREAVATADFAAAVPAPHPAVLTVIAHCAPRNHQFNQPSRPSPGLMITAPALSQPSTRSRL
jgi:hypothetical protein